MFPNYCSPLQRSTFLTPPNHLISIRTSHWNIANAINQSTCPTPTEETTKRSQQSHLLITYLNILTGDSIAT